MEEEEGGIRLSKRFSDKGGGEVDYKTTSGTAWSHSYLNQKPWHPLSYPNQRRKWIAEQTHAQRHRRNEEVAREYAQEQEFLRQTSLLSQKEKEKVDIMQAVSFMYVRPPGYNAESAKAAEIADERKTIGESDPTAASSSSVPRQAAAVKNEKKNARPKDVFGRSLPTEEEFAVLKNAPRLETGVAGRSKPFAVEVRNVKCVRCGTFGHQSGDRECPLKDAIMPNEENRLKRDDPLTTIIAHMDSSEALKWELKQKPGISPPRGGFMPDDPNQQIVAEDIFDEYGGFLSGGGIPDLLTNFSSKHKRKKSKHKKKHKKQASSRRSHEDKYFTSDDDDDRRSSKAKVKRKRKHKKRALSRYSDEESHSSSENVEHGNRSTRKEQLHMSKKKKRESSHSSMPEESESERYHGEKQALPMHTDVKNVSSSNSDGHRRKSRSKQQNYKSNKKTQDLPHSSSSENSDNGRHQRKSRNHGSPRRRESRISCKDSSSDGDHRKSRRKHSGQSKHLDSDKHRNHGSPIRWELKISREDSSSDYEKSRRKEKAHTSHKTTRDDSECSSSENSEFESHSDRWKYKRTYSSENPYSDDHYGSQASRRQRQPHHRRRHLDSSTRK